MFNNNGGKNMDKRGQGALEYLMMIGAGIAIAAVVLAFVLGSGATSTCESYKSQISGYCNTKPTEDLCEKTGDIDDKMSLGAGALADNECEWDLTQSKCVLRDSLTWEDSDQC